MRNSWLLSCVLLFQTYVFYSQSDLNPPISYIVPSVDRTERKDVVLLTKRLIQNVTSDKDKFDALYHWVAENIRYDTKRSKNGKSNSVNAANETLRSKSGICLDFAALMDEMCNIAGLESQTVPGYTKSMVFDKGDPIYFENHIWNAVKLDGKWYLYDVTWGLIGKTYGLTKVGSWRNRVIDSLSARRITKERIYRFRSYDCLTGKINKSKERFNYLTLPFFKRLFIKLLNLPPYIIVGKKSNVYSYSYYLVDPELFVLDHFPVDPIWNFSRRIQTLQEFSGDSLYGSMVGLDFANQNRKGLTCMPCDAYTAREDSTQYLLLIQSVYSSNSSNHFTPATSYGQLFLEKGLACYSSIDSLEKMRLFHSATGYYTFSKQAFRAAERMNQKEFSFQNAKNLRKKKSLLAFNKRLLKNMEKVFGELKKMENSLVQLSLKPMTINRKNENALEKYFNESNKVYQVKDTEINRKKYQERLQKQLDLYQAYSDSITLDLDILDKKSMDLSQELRAKKNLLAPLITSLKLDQFYRNYYLDDDFDDRIRKNRARMVTLQDSSVNNLQTTILDNAFLIRKSIRHLDKMLYLRNKIAIKLARSMTELNSIKLYENDKIFAFSDSLQKHIGNERCQLFSLSSRLQVAKKVWRYLYFYREIFKKHIIQDNLLEERRYKIHQKQNTINRSRQQHAIVGWLKMIQKFQSALKNHKKVYLKELKRQNS